MSGGDMLEINSDNIETMSLDHHGIVAGICKELKIAERINEKLKVHKDRKVSPGQAVVAMIINGLGFTNRRLYLSHQFFANKPVEILLGEGIKAEDITDYTLGHTLDNIYEYGSSDLFAEIGFAVALEHKLLGKNIHIDTTSISVDGEYKLDESHDESDTNIVNITYGYSKDMRPDLKQIVLSLAVSGASNLPIFMEALDGNSSDKTSFHETIKKINEFKEQLNIDHNFKWVADSALYTADKLLQSEYLWLTRVPENIKEASELVSSKNVTWQEYDDVYKFAEFDSKYGEIAQRWLLVFSKYAYEREKKTLEKQLAKKDIEVEKALWHLGNEVFSCEKDAKLEINKIAKKYKLYSIDAGVEVVSKYNKPGKPKAKDIKVVAGYRIVATFKRNATLIEELQNRKGRFILATNDLDKAAYPTSEMLKEYKEQQGVEGGFRFIKDPWFMVDSIFLKSAKRIEALMMVMTLCLLVYNFAQHRLRDSLKQRNDTIPNQLDKPVQNPTLRWVFQLMEGVGYVQILLDKTHNQCQQFVTNLSKLRQQILYHLGSVVCSMYGLIHEKLTLGLGM
jgi:transposase